MGRLTDDMTRLCGEIGALRSSREVFISDLRHDISELKAGAEKMQSGFRSEHAEMSRNMKANLGSFVSDLKSKVSDVQAGFRNDRFDMSRNMKADLLAFISELKEFASELAEDVSDMQSGFRKAHANMAAKTKGERERFLSELGQYMNVLRQEIAGFRREFADDIAGARRAWFGHFPAGTAAAETEEIKTPHAAEAATADEVIPNDFTVIAEIGPVRQGRLNKAGYYTFAQLAKSTPEKLREILGKSARSANVENWIDDARDLAQ